MRPIGLCLVVVACAAGAKTADPTPIALPTPSATSDAPMASASASPLGPNATVQATVRRWLELLASDQDERFLDEAIVPEQLDHILGTLSKADLVESFRKEKHETVVALLQGIRGKNPTTVREEGPDVLLTFASPPNQKTLTFVIRGSAVFIKD